MAQPPAHPGPNAHFGPRCVVHRQDLGHLCQHPRDPRLHRRISDFPIDPTLNDRPSNSAFQSNELIEHSSVLAIQFGHLLTDRQLPFDVTFVVEGQRFEAHKIIMAARSAYFKALLFGGMSESTQNEIALSDTQSKAFELLLGYIYSAKLNLVPFDYHLKLEVLGLAHKYEFVELEQGIANHLEKKLSVENVCEIYIASDFYYLQELAAKCLRFIDISGHNIYRTKEFLSLPARLVERLVKHCKSHESLLIDGLVLWINAHPEEIELLKAALCHLNLVVAEIGGQLHVVKSMGVINADGAGPSQAGNVAAISQAMDQL